VQNFTFRKISLNRTCFLDVVLRLDAPLIPNVSLRSLQKPLLRHNCHINMAVCFFCF
jgi:hypothetical protein